jgi:mannose-6-phosphate isomerase-like protein (cupin superfamily)
LVKFLKVEEAPVEKRSTGSVTRVVNERVGASRLGVIFVEVLPGSSAPRLHYHEKRESVYIGVEGRARVTVDDEKYIVEPNTVLLIAPGEKHGVENIGDVTFKMIEVYSPLEPDRIEI